VATGTQWSQYWTNYNRATKSAMKSRRGSSPVSFRPSHRKIVTAANKKKYSYIFFREEEDKLNTNNYTLFREEEENLTL
jgi:hypothetical protein